MEALVLLLVAVASVALGWRTGRWASVLVPFLLTTVLAVWLADRISGSERREESEGIALVLLIVYGAVVCAGTALAVGLRKAATARSA